MPDKLELKNVYLKDLTHVQGHIYDLSLEYVYPNPNFIPGTKYTMLCLFQKEGKPWFQIEREVEVVENAK